MSVYHDSGMVLTEFFFFFFVTTMGTSLAHYEADTEESSNTETEKVRKS